jgi:hypothetical protein
MTTGTLEAENDSIVIHFDTEGKRINAYTLASTLVAIADAAKAANDTINPGYEVEIVIEAIGPGSFRTKIRALYRKNRSLFSHQIALAIIVNIVSTFIYERAFQDKTGVTVQVNTDEVIIQNGNEKIVVPRTVYDATRKVEKDPRFTNAIGRTLHAISSDPEVKGLGFVKDMADPKPEFIIPRTTLALAAVAPAPEPDQRVVNEIVDLQIIKAILERGPRKWEFMWRGVRISAPIIHEDFYNSFDARRITIAPGDILRARLVITQRRDTKTGIYSNEAYVVTEIFDHVPRLKQSELPKMD